MAGWFLFLLLIELLYWSLRLRRQRKREKQIKKTLYRLLEQTILERALKKGISNEAAAGEVMNRRYLYLEFPDTKPLLGALFDLHHSLTIGRDEENRLCIRDAGVSRLHCKIRDGGEALIIQDMGTANGTKVRRSLFQTYCLKPGEQIYLYPGDMVSLGIYRFRVQTYGGFEAVR